MINVCCISNKITERCLQTLLHENAPLIYQTLSQQHQNVNILSQSNEKLNGLTANLPALNKQEASFENFTHIMDVFASYITVKLTITPSNI